MSELYNILKQYSLISHYNSNKSSDVLFTSSYCYIEIDRFDRIVLSSEDKNNLCVINRNLSYKIESIPFGHDLITIIDCDGNVVQFDAQK